MRLDTNAEDSGTSDALAAGRVCFGKPTARVSARQVPRAVTALLKADAKFKLETGTGECAA